MSEHDRLWTARLRAAAAHWRERYAYAQESLVLAIGQLEQISARADRAERRDCNQERHAAVRVVALSVELWGDPMLNQVRPYVRFYLECKRCGATGTRLRETGKAYHRPQDLIVDGVYWEDQPAPPTEQTECHCGRALLFPGEVDPWCEGCTMSARTCGCVPVPEVPASVTHDAR